MEITFSAANTVGLNNPGTEIITLVKDGSGNFINPPSYDKMRAYLRSGEVPMLFVTAEGGETGSLYQLVDYSETENKIRFSNSANAIEFCAGCEVPVVSDVGGGGGGWFVVTASDDESGNIIVDHYRDDIAAAFENGKMPIVKTTIDGETRIMNMVSITQYVANFIYVTLSGSQNLADVMLQQINIGKEDVSYSQRSIFGK